MICLQPVSGSVVSSITDFAGCEALNGYAALTLSEYHDLTNLIGFLPVNWEQVQWAFGSALLLWVAGVSIGLVVNMVRKAR